MSEEKQDISKFDVSILKEDNSLLIILLFDNEDFAKFLNLNLEKEPYAMYINKKENGLYDFCIKFTNSQYDFKGELNRTEEDYIPLSWLKEPLGWSISVGLIGEGNNYKRFHEIYPQSKQCLN